MTEIELTKIALKIIVDSCSVVQSISSSLNPYPIGISLPRPLHTGARIFLQDATMNQKLFLKRFIERVNKRGPVQKHIKNIGKCWEWTGSINQYGYGRLQVDGREVGAHRISYQLFKGEIPQGNLVCHKCDFRRCVNPKHLWTGTNTQNIADRTAKGRTWYGKKPEYSILRGERNPNSRLTPESVRAIRRSRKTPLQLAVLFGVGRSNIYMILERHAWKHIK